MQQFVNIDMEYTTFYVFASETGDFRLDALQTGVWVRPERAAVAQ